MCNIVTFRFTCLHTLRRRRSRCNGTKHKITASSIKAACVAESFLTIYLRVECGPCQQTAWEETWRVKLERATEFLDKLRQRNMPGGAEVERLVRELEVDYASASWDTRNMFAQAIKRSVGRVKHTWRERAPSPLPREVFPNDVVETARKEWSQMKEHEYDGNYVASTDPIHPVSTDYSHPFDDDDGSWISQYLSSEDVQTASNHVDIDFTVQGSHWTWNDDSHQPQTPTPSSDEVFNAEAHTSGFANSLDFANDTTGLIACGPNAERTSQPHELTKLSTKEDAKFPKDAVDKVVRAFWSIVNTETSTPRHTTHTQTPPDQNLSHILSSLNISSPTDNHHRSSALLTASTNLSNQPNSIPWTDGPADDILLTSLTPPDPRPCSTPPTPNSTRAWYKNQRQFLTQRKQTDLTKFYADWLHISRCEMRDFEGAGGRLICEPDGGRVR